MKRFILFALLLLLVPCAKSQQSADQLISAGMAYDSRGVSDSAIACFQMALQSDSSNVEALWRIGGVYLRLDSLRLAIDYSMAAIDRDPKNKDAYYTIGSAFFAQQRYKSAEEHLRRAVEFGGPGFVMAWCKLGEASLMLGDTAQAVACFNTVIENDAAFQRAYYNLGEISRDKSQWAQAIEYYGMAIRKFPLYPEAHYNMALCYMQVGNLKKAIESLEKVCKMQPQNDEAWYQLGRAHYQNSDNDKALKALRRAVEIKPDHAQAQQMLSALSE